MYGMRIGEVKLFGNATSRNLLADRELDLINRVHDVDVTRFQRWNDEVTSLDGRICTAYTAVPTEMMELILQVPCIQPMKNGAIGG